MKSIDEERAANHSSTHPFNPTKQKKENFLFNLFDFISSLMKWN